jgi:hypothetical protein
MAATDKKTLELIAQVKAERAAIAKAEKPAYKTNCSFSYIEGNKGSATNIHVETDVKRLILMAAFLAERQGGYRNAAKLLGVDNPPDFTWDNFTADEWITDIKARIAKIQISARKEKLEDLEKRLNKIVRNYAPSQPGKAGRTRT